jgi:hypothetical protein
MERMGGRQDITDAQGSDGAVKVSGILGYCLSCEYVEGTDGAWA